jgi:hypothetical protein
MKTLFTLVLTVLISTVCFAQNGINYKAIIKDNNGNVAANDLVVVQFTILQGVAQTTVYQESHTPTTDANGLIIINIGEGTPISGTFATIDWANDSTFLKTQINTGSGLVDMGTTEFKTVPYAKNAETAANVTGLEALNEGGNQGWRLKGTDPNNYGNIGLSAIDLSINMSPSTTFGATGYVSTALGSNTEASGAYSTAMGYSTIASNYYSTAIGSGTTASGDASLAAGYYSTASEYASTAMGLITEASGYYSTAMGNSTKAQSVSSTALGQFNVGGGDVLNWVATDPLFEIGNGIDNTARTNALTVLKNGTITAPSFDLAEITDPKALITKEYADTNLGTTGLEAINEGNGMGWRLKGRNPINYGDLGSNAVDLSISLVASSTAGATGSYGTATGYGTKASNIYATALGVFSEASGNSSIAMGRSTLASGGYSTAMGYLTEASANSSTALGRSTLASGSNSTAMGYETNALSINSTAMGNGTIASGNNSIAMGFETEASGTNSIAMGEESVASGSNSISLGFGTRASSYASLAIGRCNVGGGSATTWVGTDPVFEIGNGFYMSFPPYGAYRLNSFTVLKNGKVGIGTSTPSTYLHITEGTEANYTDSSGYFVLGNVTESNLVFDNNEIMARNNGAAAPLYLQQGGGDVRVGGVVVHSSDFRLKKDITPLTYGLETILELNPVEYNWKNREQEFKSLGLIAQDVQPVLENIVHVADDEDQTLSVSYTELIPVLINAVKELKAENDALKSRVEALENNQ